jgi:hypothetical protein
MAENPFTAMKLSPPQELLCRDPDLHHFSAESLSSRVVTLFRSYILLDFGSFSPSKPNTFNLTALCSPNT